MESTALSGQTEKAAAALNFSLAASAITFAEDSIICCLMGNSSASMAPTPNSSPIEHAPRKQRSAWTDLRNCKTSPPTIDIEFFRILPEAMMTVVPGRRARVSATARLFVTAIKARPAGTFFATSREVEPLSNRTRLFSLTRLAAVLPIVHLGFDPVLSSASVLAGLVLIKAPPCVLIAIPARTSPLRSRRMVSGETPKSVLASSTRTLPWVRKRCSNSSCRSSAKRSSWCSTDSFYSCSVSIQRRNTPSFGQAGTRYRCDDRLAFLPVRFRAHLKVLPRKSDFVWQRSLDQGVSCLVRRPTNHCNLDPEGTRALAADRDFPLPAVKK